MCTAIVYRNGHTYFGRNLDLERGYGECVVITPRHFPLPFRYGLTSTSHYAMIGMAAVRDGYPLYFEATNEVGLSMAGLNFPGNADYQPLCPDKENITPFEFLPWLLGNCANLAQVRQRLSQISLVNAPFSPSLPLSPLHWLISDQDSSIVVEPLEGGLAVYDNPFEVLTNNPPFPYHRIHASNYMSLSVGPAPSRFASSIPMVNYSLGMGALGLPGDFSSSSRFVKALFVKENAVSDGTEAANVCQFFHILQTVAMPKGCVLTENGFEYTRYSSCCNAQRGIYSYTTYDQSTITSLDLHAIDLEETRLFSFPISV